MKVLLSRYVLKYPRTGIGWYTYFLLKGLQAHKAVDELVGIPFVTKGHRAGRLKKIFLFSKIKKIMQSHTSAYTYLNCYRNYRFKKKTHNFSNRNFIYHEPCYILKPYCGFKVCNVHDLSHIYYPESHPKERVNFLLRYLPVSLNQADHIITGSYFIRQEIINTFKIAAEKITTIYHGVSNAFRPRHLFEMNFVLARYGLLGKTYLLSVGTLEPRKNLIRLIHAFKQLPEWLRKRYPLVLVGVKGWNLRPLEKLIDQLSRKGELYCLGYISSVDLPYLYSSAYAFVYLSIYEGFGLPLLESLASGIPTLASKTSSMPEIVEGSALLVDPFDIDAITERLERLLTDSSLRLSLKLKGVKQAAKFSWQKCVNSTVNVYQQLLDSVS